MQGQDAVEGYREEQGQRHSREVRDVRRDQDLHHDFHNPVQPTETPYVPDKPPTPPSTFDQIPPLPSKAFNPASNNPYRQKESAISPNAAPEQNPYSYESISGGQIDGTVLPSGPLPEQVEKPLPIRTTASDEPPRLEWQDPRSPVDPTGFSGGYFSELRELQQGILNSDKPQGNEPGAQEVEAAVLNHKSSLQASPPEIVEGPPDSIQSPVHVPSAAISTATRYVSLHQFRSFCYMDVTGALPTCLMSNP